MRNLADISNNCHFAENCCNFWEKLPGFIEGFPATNEVVSQPLIAGKNEKAFDEVIPNFDASSYIGMYFKYFPTLNSNYNLVSLATL